MQNQAVFCSISKSTGMHAGIMCMAPLPSQICRMPGQDSFLLRPGWPLMATRERADDNATIGAVVVRAKLDLKKSPLELASVEKLWVQQPKVSGKGHYSHRIAFGPDGKMFITSGDRQKLAPAQNFDGHLGKVLRLNDDGTVPKDNPWQDRGEIAKQFWTVGHPNMLGIDFDANGRLWVHEMGPRHGDELKPIF